MRTLLALLSLGLLSACDVKPTLTALVQSSGPERSLVMIKGTELKTSKIVWDAGLPSEKIIPGSLFGATMFSVPIGATLGHHPVAVENQAGRSNILLFGVTSKVPFGIPRLDHVTVNQTPTFQDGDVSLSLYLSGANIDIGAAVVIDGSLSASIAHKGLKNDLLGLNPAKLGYPIYHYLGMVAVPPKRPAGSKVFIILKNLDGKTSKPFEYTLPQDLATLDSDGDSLPDAMEINGFDPNNDGQLEVNLKAFGAHPLRRDLLVEVDVMEGLVNPPTDADWKAAKDMFRAAPILNPVNLPGINLGLDIGSMPHVTFISFSAPNNPPNSAPFNALKKNHFDNKNRDDIFYYAIWGDRYLNLPNSGDGDSIKTLTELLGGDDFFVTMDTFKAECHAPRGHAETFNHELGHLLGLKHGGFAYTPTHQSLMSYRWQLRFCWNADFHLKNPTCLPLYYGVPNATEPNGNTPAMVNSTIDYSEGMIRTLTENNNSLNEHDGICGFAIDWNKNGVLETGVSANIDTSGNPEPVLTDFANWKRLIFGGPKGDGEEPDLP